LAFVIDKRILGTYVAYLTAPGLGSWSFVSELLENRGRSFRSGHKCARHTIHTAPEASSQNQSAMSMLSRSGRSCLPFLFVVSLAGSALAAQKEAARPDLIFVQAAVVQAGNPAERFPQGSRIARLDRRSALPTNLTAEFFAAADPQVSFDGSKILFAAKEKPASPWQVWEMNADGTAKRQVTHCPDDCLRPAYLPREEIVYTALTHAGADSASQSYVSKRDGSEEHPITFGPGDYEVETVLQNGTILASARSPLLPAGAGLALAGKPVARGLYTLRPDGSGLAAFRSDDGTPVTRSEAAELDDGSVVFVKRDATSQAAVGQLAMVRRGALHNSRLGASSGLACAPKRLSADTLAVARASASGKPKFDLYAFDTARGQFTELIYRDPKLSSLAAVPVAAHATPRWYWSTLNPALQEGYFICLDSHTSGDGLRGRGAASLSKVRVLALESASGRERSLGEAPIEKDGSFYLAVPPDRPVRFELLDAAGRVVSEQRSWIWSRSGEEHGCVGCHENRALAPENRWPLALRRFDAPIRLK